MFTPNENRSCSHPGNQIQLQVLLEVAILIHELPLFWVTFGWISQHLLQFFHTHTHTHLPRQARLGFPNINFYHLGGRCPWGGLERSTSPETSPGQQRGVGREKWHIAMNSLWRLHHENKKINHKDINSLTLKWNQQRIIHVRVHLYTHTHCIQKQRLTSPRPLRPT